MKPDSAKKRKARKTGKSFERLIARIQKSVHDRAEIGVNEKLKDVDTDKLRQIDITIRLSDGPTHFFGIVEVRDRSRPIGVRYVEEIFGKQRSVKADAAFLVSKSGFTKTAITKAKQLAIRTLSYEEAQEADWSSWLQCRTISVLSRKYDKPIIIIFEKGMKNKVIEISTESLEELKKNKSLKIILDKDGNPLLSLPELINKIVNIYGEKPFQNIPYDGSRIRTKLLFNGKYDQPIFLKDKDGQVRQIGKVGLEAELYFDNEEFPFKLARYKEEGSSSSIAELATADVSILGKKYRFELLAPRAGDFVPEGATITFHSTPLKDDGDNT
ncbi:MAG: restriction endonuclease [Desulfobacterales bacterium]|nr:restriction endonuclease [Desulfobacterales bacterium]